MSHYKWTSPYEWLVDVSYGWNSDTLRVNLLALALRSDPGTIQDIFQTDMDKDGYFEKEDKK